jgi:hypothetical protein
MYYSFKIHYSKDVWLNINLQFWLNFDFYNFTILAQLYKTPYLTKTIQKTQFSWQMITIQECRNARFHSINRKLEQIWHSDYFIDWKLICVVLLRAIFFVIWLVTFIFWKSCIKILALLSYNLQTLKIRYINDNGDS